jgi:hypothetical protein
MGWSGRARALPVREAGRYSGPVSSNAGDLQQPAHIPGTSVPPNIHYPAPFAMITPVGNLVRARLLGEGGGTHVRRAADSTNAG